nr:MAG TPA: NEMP family [Caudoviricetes sp.]
MILSDEEYLEFIKEGQKFALKKLKDYFKNDVEKEVQDDTKI